MDVESKLTNLCHRHLVGKEPDIVAFVEQIFNLLKVCNKISGKAADNNLLIFKINDKIIINCCVEAAIIKIRMICAHIAVLCKDKTGTTSGLYGGFFTITHEKEKNEILVELKNTSNDHYFVIARRLG